jgi:hypothetical protein
MRKLAFLLLGTAMIAALPVQAETRRGGEAELARVLEGRVAGEPVDCIDLHRVRSSRVIEDTAIVYDAGGTLYVNRPRNGAEELNRFDAMLTRLPTTRLCSVDTVTMFDTTSRMMTGIVFLGEFVPYRRVRD